MQRADYQRGMYIKGAIHHVLPPYTRGMLLKGGPVSARFLKKRPTPNTSLVEIEERLAQAAKRLQEIAAMVRRR